MPTSEQLSLICPACSTRLRLSAADVPQSDFDCPDCSAPLLVNRAESGELSVSRADPDETPVSSTGLLLQPRLIAGVVTVAAAIGLIAISFSGEPEEAGADWQRLSNEAPSVGEPGDIAQAPSAPEQPTDETVPELLPEPSIELAVAEPEIEIRPPVGDDPASRIPADRVEQPETVDLDNTPILPELSPDERIDVQPILPPFTERIAISIPSFDQSKPTPLSSVIEVVEQLTLVSVETDAVPDELLSRPVSFTARDATPVDILKAAIRQTGLRIVVDEQAESINLVLIDPQSE